MRLAHCWWMSLGLAVVVIGRAPVATSSTPPVPDVQQGHRPARLQSLRRVSPARVDGADVAADLRRRAAVGQGDQAEGDAARDAAVGRRPGRRQVRQRPQPVAGRDRPDRRVGGRRRARRQSRRSAAGADVHRRLVDRQARSRLHDAEAVQRAGRRNGAVRLRHDSDQPQGRHLDSWRRAQAERSSRRAPHHQRPGRGRRQAGRSRAEADARSIAQGNRRRAGRPRARPALRAV